jgi:hypothetical protein
LSQYDPGVVTCAAGVAGAAGFVPLSAKYLSQYAYIELSTGYGLTAALAAVNIKENINKQVANTYRRRLILDISISPFPLFRES